MHANASDFSQLEARDRENIDSLARHHTGHASSSIVRIAAGLGTRRFYRVHFADRHPASLIARVEADATPAGAPDPLEAPAWLPEPPLEPIRQFLDDAGLRVPVCIGHEPDQGIDLLEDVGERTLKDIRGPAREALYREACEIVPRMQSLSSTPDAIPAFGRIFDAALVNTKAWKWLHWTIPGLLGRPATEPESNALHSVFDGITRLLADAPRRLAHRDFKAENLHLIHHENPIDEERGAPQDQIVMIDVQGAFMAPPEYDLVCLLYDLQVDLDEDFVMECFASVRPKLPDRPDPHVAGRRFDAIAVVRLCKDIAHLVHAARVRDDWRRWHEIPRGLALLGRSAGRLSPVFPQIEALNSVIHALTLAASSTDSPRQDQ